MSIRVKTLFIIFSMLTISICLHGAIYFFVLKPGFYYLERREAEKNLNRPVEAVKRELHHLSALVQDWSSWDETYEFIGNQNKAYIEANLSPQETYEINNINALALYDTNGNTVWRKTVDIETKNDIFLPEVPEKKCPPGHPFVYGEISGPGMLEPTTGIIKTRLGPMLVAARPVLKSNNKGPPGGSLVMGRLMTGKAISDLNVQTDVAFKILPIETTRADNIAGIEDLFSGKTERFIDDSDKRNLYLYSVIDDIEKKHTFVIKAVMPREIMKKGVETLNYSMFITLSGGILMTILIMVLLNRAILRPIAELSRHAMEIGETGDLSARVDLNRNDEIGSLGKRFDSMLMKLADIRSELLDQSYYSGLAVVASDVLHHMGNILMPMIQKIDVLMGMCQSLPKENIRRALSEMEQGPSDPERETSLRRFMHLSTMEMVGAIENASLVLNDIERSTKEMEQIMGTLEKYSRRQAAGRRLSMGPVLRDAVSRMPESVKTGCRIRFLPDLDSLPEIMSDPIILAQVFRCILGHSVVFAQEGAVDGAEVVVSGKTDTRGTVRRIVVKVGGNGGKIDEIRIGAMFSRYSASDSLDCFHADLHWCSNVVAAMGGELKVSSDAHGTVFFLSLPLGGEL
jgi:sensor domain CHASE-containing protein